jgi:hypothetical protein
MLTKRKMRIRIFSCKKLNQCRMEIQVHKVHSSVQLKLLECYMCQAVNSKYLSSSIPGDLNVHKYCCENLTILYQMLHHTDVTSPEY